MKLYLVSEINKENNITLRTWVCLTNEKAKECLKLHYELATLFSKKAPVDTLEYGFFYWEDENINLKYEISHTKTF